MESVLYTQRVEVISSYKERRDCSDQRIPEFIWSCGYLPVPVPNIPHIADEMAERLHPCGIVLTGGNSLVKYGGDAPERDETDRVLLVQAINRNIPLYGICRGMQSILDCFGNELVNAEGHTAVRHTVKGNGKSFNVNSYHNQACLNLTNDILKVVMKSDDGVIEMIKHSILPIAGTMWHPEREQPFTQESIGFVKGLFSGD